MGFDEHGRSGDEYDVFDYLGSDVYDYQPRAWRAMEVRLDFTPKTGRSPEPPRSLGGASPIGGWLDEVSWFGDRQIELAQVAARYAGPYRAADVEPDWTTFLPPFDVAVRGKNTITWHERDGIWLNARDAAHYDAIMASARANYEAERNGTWVQPED